MLPDASIFSDAFFRQLFDVIRFFIKALSIIGTSASLCYFAVGINESIARNPTISSNSIFLLVFFSALGLIEFAAIYALFLMK